jgi:hypothetical protein
MMRLDRSTWLISGIACAAIGFGGAMVLYTTVSHNSSWEWDISLALLALGFAGLALGAVVVMGLGPFRSVRLPRSKQKWRRYIARQVSSE